MKDLKYLNTHFQEFVDNIRKVRKNVEEEGEYTKGYLDCMKEIIDGSISGDLPNWMGNIEKRNDMKLRKEVIDEILTGMETLLDAYKKKDSE